MADLPITDLEEKTTPAVAGDFVVMIDSEDGNKVKKQEALQYEGPAGANGADGTDGSDGSDGSDGTDGKTILNGIIDPVVGDGVDGDFFINIATSAIFGPKTSGTWGAGTSLIGADGADGTPGADGADGTDGTNGTNGIDGLSVNWQGVYSGATAYVINDSVSYNGGSYICILATTGNIPTNASYWGILAEKGADGAGSGDMMKSVYDPTNINGSAFDRSNHTGSQAISTVTNLQDALDGKQMKFSTVKTSVNVSPAVAFTEYLVNASGGDVTIDLPDVTAGNYDEYRVVLSEDTNKCLITTVGGSQIIGPGSDTVYVNHTVGGSLFFRGNGVDGYDIVGDSREYYRVVDLDGAGTTNLSVSGYESIAIYHCSGMIAGETRTIVIPDDPSTFEGFAFKTLLDGDGTVIIKTLSGININGNPELTITNDGGGVEICSFGDHYNIVQDSRPKAQNVALTFYSLGEDSTIVDPGATFYKQTSNSIDDSRFDQVTATLTTAVVTVSGQYAGGLIGDEGVIGGVLPEGPVTSSVTATNTAGSGFATYYIEYYKWEVGGTETLLGTSTASSEINSSDPTAYIVTATLPETIFGSTDRLLRKVFYNRTGGGSNPTINFYAEGSNPSFSRVAIGASSISHNILAGIQLFASGVEKGHIDFDTQVATGTANNDKLATQGYVDDNAGGGSGGSVTTFDKLEVSGTQSVGVISSFRASQAGTLAKFSAFLEGVPTGTSFIADLKIEGVVVATVTITAGNTSGTTTTFTDNVLTEGDRIIYEITQVGSSVAGSSLTIALNLS